MAGKVTSNRLGEEALALRDKNREATGLSPSDVARGGQVALAQNKPLLEHMRALGTARELLDELHAKYGRYARLRLRARDWQGVGTSIEPLLVTGDGRADELDWIEVHARRAGESRVRFDIYDSRRDVTIAEADVVNVPEAGIPLVALRQRLNNIERVLAPTARIPHAYLGRPR